MTKGEIPENLIVPLPESWNNADYFDNDILRSSKLPCLVELKGCKIKELAKKYAPFIYFHKCEEYFPCDPTEFFKQSELRYRTKDILLENVKLVDIFSGTIPNELNCHKRFSDRGLFKERNGFYLALKDGNNKFIFGINPKSWTNQVPPVYFSFHLAEQNHFIITYWFFYAYNDFINNHEGDWEGIDLKFQAIKEDGNLKYVLDGLFYHAHNNKKEFKEPSNFYCKWNRPLVFVATGSHASKKGSPSLLKKSNGQPCKAKVQSERAVEEFGKAKENEEFNLNLKIEELLSDLEILFSGDQDLSDSSSIADLMRSKKKLDQALIKMKKILKLDDFKKITSLSKFENILMNDLKNLSPNSYSKLKNILSCGTSETKGIRERIGAKYCWDSSKNLQALTKKVEWVKFGGLWGKLGKMKCTSGPFSPYHKFEEVSCSNIDENILCEYPIVLFPEWFDDDSET